ncbi:MAG TPA: hypothetical protein DCL80_16105 [Balneola sp.]|jgi:hypothetical protein|nr:hypothetical protein [Balneola sp.]MAO78316.1 hypothetical protein [Balneola sp.]MBF64317.1 hypothetical protein [Balneola sp.]HAH52692.1 hypothetical protein [Balneola sp.]HAW81533.1 hypothetical protein [Balneola sp.]|tara:strand:- start:25064 stop:25921 length:858 start_codon:yes stop_codon:yes gene_type:complete
MRTITIIILISFFSISTLSAQMERKRADPDGPVEETFLTKNIAGLGTVQLLGKGDLNSMIQHNFGDIRGGIDTFFGIDEGANVRIAFGYGLTDNLNIGIGRTSREDNIDFSLDYRVLHQTKLDKIPVSVVFKGDLGIRTQKESFSLTFQERLNYLGSVMIARKFSDNFSFQVSPMVAHFNTVVKREANSELYNTLLGLGFAGRIKINERKSISFEYLPVIGDRISDTKNHAALVYELETGGHVFQMFLMSGRWFTEQHLLAKTETNFFEPNFRFGFNVNRIFGLL